MCTGDKFSTALTISRTCNLYQKADVLVTLEGANPGEVCRVSAVPIVNRRCPSSHTRTRDHDARTAACVGVCLSSTPLHTVHCLQVESSLRKARQLVADTQYAVSSVASGGPGLSIGIPKRTVAYTVIVRGDTVEVALEQFSEQFSELMLGARSAVCCRYRRRR